MQSSVVLPKDLIYIETFNDLRLDFFCATTQVKNLCSVSIINQLLQKPKFQSVLFPLCTPVIKVVLNTIRFVDGHQIFDKCSISRLCLQLHATVNLFPKG